MKNHLIVLASALMFGCAHTPTMQISSAMPEREVTVSQLPPAKIPGEMAQNPYVVSDDENPYDALIAEQAAEEAEAAKNAAQAEQDRKLHELMVKAVWGNCAPGDPQCSVINEPEVKADSK